MLFAQHFPNILLSSFIHSFFFQFYFSIIVRVPFSHSLRNSIISYTTHIFYTKFSHFLLHFVVPYLLFNSAKQLWVAQRESCERLGAFRLIRGSARLNYANIQQNDSRLFPWSFPPFSSKKTRNKLVQNISSSDLLLRISSMDPVYTYLWSSLPFKLPLEREPSKTFFERSEIQLR